MFQVVFLRFSDNGGGCFMVTWFLVLQKSEGIFWRGGLVFILIYLVLLRPGVSFLGGGFLGGSFSCLSFLEAMSSFLNPRGLGFFDRILRCVSWWFCCILRVRRHF